MAMQSLYFGDSDDSDSEVFLPHPEPLARSAFLAPDFSPGEFLSSLQDRHQTLEDLRQELRTRSQEVNKELVDLVNDNYRDFLSLGVSLQGGDERVEEVRLGLLSFKGAIDGLAQDTARQRMEVELLLRRRKALAATRQKGLQLLELDTRLTDLETSLGIRASSLGDSSDKHQVDIDFSDSEDSSEDASPQTKQVLLLSRRVQQYVVILKLQRKLGLEHPFIKKLQPRLDESRRILRLDLDSAMGSINGEPEAALLVLGLYRQIDALPRVSKGGAG